MSKRFTDTKIWNKQWFRVLPPRLKEFWRYVCDNCDGFGVWDIDLATASHFINEPITMDDLKVFEGRLYQIGNKLWCPRWLKFHYKKFNTTNKVHIAVARKVIPLADGLSLDEPSQKIIDELKQLIFDLELTPNQPPPDPQPSPNQGIQEKGIRKEEKGKGKKEKEEEGGAGETNPPAPNPVTSDLVKACCNTWRETLAAFKQERGLTQCEEIEIARAIQKNGAEFVDLALYGARHEPSVNNWHAKDHVDITRVLLPDRDGKERIQKFVGYGAKHRQAEAEAEAKKLADAENAKEFEEAATDPAVISKALASFAGYKSKRMPA